MPRVARFYDPATNTHVVQIHTHEYRLHRVGISFQLWIDGELHWLGLDEIQPYRDAFGGFLQAIMDEQSEARGICPRSGDPIDPYA
jgi:hypothetical protein